MIFNRSKGSISIQLKLLAVLYDKLDMRWCLRIFLIPLLNWSDHPSTRKDTPCWLSTPLYIERTRISKANTLEIRKCSAKIYRSVSTYMMEKRWNYNIQSVQKSQIIILRRGKKVIINLKSNDFVRDCYSSVFHFSLMSKWVDIFLDPIIVDEEIVSPPNLPTRRPREISEKRSHWHCHFLFACIPSPPFWQKKKKKNTKWRSWLCQWVSCEVELVTGARAKSI